MSARDVGGALLAALLALLCACRSTSEGEEAVEVELDLVFRGGRAFPEEALRTVALRELERKDATEPTKADVDDAAFALETFYRRQGYPFARVEYALEERPGERALALFTIDEGPRTRVRELVLEGFDAVPEEKARAYFGGASQGGVLDEDALEESRDQLLRYYVEQGFLRVQLDDLEIELDEGREQAVVTLRIEEGPAFRVRAVEFEGTAREVVGKEDDLREALLRKPYGPWLDVDLGRTLSEAHGREGYPDAAVEVSSALDEETGEVTLVATAVPGDRVRIAHVVVEGNERTRSSAIRSMLDIEEGDVYDAEEVRLGFRRLFATGLFETIEIEPRGTGEERDLVVRVTEGRAVQVRVEPGWGSYDGPRITLAIEEANFAGRMHRVGIEGTASLRGQSARVGWVDPAFLGTQFAAEVAVTPERREEPSFEYSRIGMGFFLRRRWTVDWSTSFGYEYRPTEFTDDLQPLPQDLGDSADVAEFSAAVILDDRDSPLLPTRGQRARFRVAWADDGFGSQIEFISTQLDFTQLFRVGDDGVLAAAARTGVIRPFGQTQEIPLPERLFNGGESSVRSFDEDELGPSDSAGEPIGGEGSTTLNLEYRHSITGSLAGAVFADAGNVIEDWRDALDFRELRYGFGVGLRYLLPVGPVRLDAGWNPRPRDASLTTDPAHAEEDEWSIHLSVGFPF